VLRTWILGIICVLVTGCFVAYTITVQREEALRSAESQLVNAVHYLHLDIERTFYGINQTFKGLQSYLAALNIEENSTATESLKTTLVELERENPFVMALLILDSSGKTQFWSGTRVMPDLHYSDFFAVHKNHSLQKLFVGRPVAFQHNSDRWSFGVSKGLRNEAGLLTSVMVAIIDLNYMQHRYRFQNLPIDMTLTISSSDDYIYLQLPETDATIGRQVSGITKQSADPEKTLLTRNISLTDQSVRLMASRQVGSYPLHVSLKQLESTILASWKKSASNFLLLGGLISTVLLFMTHQIACQQKKQLIIREELSRLARTDPLTGLANRRFVVEQAEHEIRKAKRSQMPISFLLVDLDHFKAVNDKYGHAVGDRVLKETAKIFQRLCRESDVVSRFGGEEFLLVLPNTPLDGALADAERIRRAVERNSHWSGNQQFSITASFGVSEWLFCEENSEPALQRADDALYKVKNTGRNSIMSQPLANVTPLRKNYRRNGRCHP